MTSGVYTKVPEIPTEQIHPILVAVPPELWAKVKHDVRLIRCRTSCDHTQIRLQA